jgi:hypothetical protein
MPRFAETVEPLFPIAGLTLVGLVLYQIYTTQESFANMGVEGMTTSPKESRGMILGSTDESGRLNTVLQDETGQTTPVLLSLAQGVSEPPKRTLPGSLSIGSDSLPTTMTTQFGSVIPVSSNPKADDLLHYNPDNFDMTYHSLDPAQYFGLKDLINKDGTLNFDKLYDLYAPVQIGPKPYQVSYKDSVLFTQYG